MSDKREIVNVEEIFGDLPLLETKRLILRKMTLEDAEDLFSYASDSEVARYVVWECHNSPEDSVRYLNAMIRRYSERALSEWGVVFKDNNRFIGTCGYVVYSPGHARAELAYALSREYWNRGLATEAVKEIIRFGFEGMRLNRIEARCYVENSASQRVLEKVGMSYEGTLREQMYIKGNYTDMKLYSLLRKDSLGFSGGE